MFLVGSLISDRNWRLLAPVVYAGALLLLLAVLSPVGAIRQGAQRWISLGLIDLQPSEVAKPAVILALAVLLSPTEENRMRWLRIAKASALAVIPAALIFVQPDLGTMLVFGFVTLVMLFVAGTTVRQLTCPGGRCSIVALASGSRARHPSRTTRWSGSPASSTPSEQTLSVNYNQNQSQIAIGSGGLFGQGLFEGTQTNLAFVPSQRTDFIFTAVGRAARVRGRRRS